MKQKHKPYNRLKGKLREKGMSYNDISALLQITPTAVSQKINGKSDFLLSQAMQVEELTGLEIKNFTL